MLDKYFLSYYSVHIYLLQFVVRMICMPYVPAKSIWAKILTFAGKTTIKKSGLNYKNTTQVALGYAFARYFFMLSYSPHTACASYVNLVGYYIILTEVH